MFKKILLILMIGVLGFGVVGCSDDLSDEELAKCEKEYSNLEKILDEITIVWFEEIFKGIYYENDNMEFEGDITNRRVVKVTFDEETLNKSKETLKEKRKIIDDININRLKKYAKYVIKNDEHYKDITKKEKADILKRTSDIRKILNQGLNIYEELLNQGEKLEYNEEECKELDNSFLKIHDMIDEEIPELLR
ncbi:hypothetical protein QIW52_17590 [Clostridioides difficile]|nr:hypothetical protein [Clostridioides difficile]